MVDSVQLPDRNKKFYLDMNFFTTSIRHSRQHKNLHQISVLYMFPQKAVDVSI
jgi:hypothetical protein